MKKPVIGITLDLARNSEKYSYSLFPWYALRKDYADCVVMAGGIPIFLPYSADMGAMLDIIDGLIIPGGDEDINPRFYGQEIVSDKVKTNDERAEFELHITKKAVERNMPVLGICNGLQVINVIFGGTLIQHLPDKFNSHINHEQPHPKNIPTHGIIIEADSILGAMVGPNTEVVVNSTHHQAIDELGKGLSISARAPDGVIEAVESKDHKFLIAVQWHSEYLNSELDENLFKKLVEHCL
jgi:putative glutamine amidotransferase